MATDPAVQQANQALAPILAELKRQQAEEAGRAASAQNTAAGTAQGLAGVLGQIPDQIKGDYKAAGDSAFEYGRRLGQTFATGSKEAAAELQNVLAQNGSPQTIHAAGDAGGSVIAGVGGLIPGTALAREGAAFTSAARGLGAAALGRGQEQSATIGRDSATKIAQLDALLREQKAKLPGLTQDFRQQALENKRADKTLGLNVRQDARAERELKLREKESNRPSPQLFGGADTGYMTFDPKTGRVTRLTQPAPAGSGRAPELIGTADTGYYAWDAGSGTITPVLGAATKPEFTPKEVREFKRDAADIAYNTFWGIKDKDGKWESEPLHYQAALRELLDEQIPLDVAQNALNRWWKKPGQVADIASRKMGSPGKVYWFSAGTKQDARGRPLKAIQERKPQGEPVDPTAEADANTYGGTTRLPGKAIPGWNDKSIPPKVRNALAIANAQVGKPYVWGGESPEEGGFDCSGLLEYAFEQAGLPTPGRLTTYSAMKLGKPVKGAMKPGDWIIVNGGKHIVMYAGKGQVIAAPHRGSTVQYQPVSRFKGSIVAVRRFAG